MSESKDRKRVARYGESTIVGFGVVDDRNGPTSLVFKIEGIALPVLLNTREWSVEWAPEEEA